MALRNGGMGLERRYSSSKQGVGTRDRFFSGRYEPHRFNAHLSPGRRQPARWFGSRTVHDYWNIPQWADLSGEMRGSYRSFSLYALANLLGREGMEVVPVERENSGFSAGPVCWNAGHLLSFSVFGGDRIFRIRFDNLYILCRSFEHLRSLDQRKATSQEKIVAFRPTEMAVPALRMGSAPVARLSPNQ